jgi:2-polyprenyl-6-methoxyphenol hydroxylase-like FAD-dependent oxidoreductase
MTIRADDRGLGPDVIIVGAGIGGCAAALSLYKAGVRRVRVFEAAVQVQPLGVGINLQASGVLALHELGLRDRLEATAIQTRQLNYCKACLTAVTAAACETAAALRRCPCLLTPGCRVASDTAEGREIISDPRGCFAGYKVPQYSIHRGHLQMILLGATRATLGEEHVSVGHRLLDFEQVGTGSALCRSFGQPYGPHSPRPTRPVATGCHRP